MFEGVCDVCALCVGAQNEQYDTNWSIMKTDMLNSKANRLQGIRLVMISIMCLKYINIKRERLVATKYAWLVLPHEQSTDRGWRRRVQKDQQSKKNSIQKSIPICIDVWSVFHSRLRPTWRQVGIEILSGCNITCKGPNLRKGLKTTNWLISISAVWVVDRLNRKLIRIYQKSRRDQTCMCHRCLIDFMLILDWFGVVDWKPASIKSRFKSDRVK